jgi:hypothetical protein
MAIATIAGVEIAYQMAGKRGSAAGADAALQCHRQRIHRGRFRPRSIYETIEIRHALHGNWPRIATPNFARARRAAIFGRDAPLAIPVWLKS